MRSIALHRWREDRLPLLLLVVTFVIMSYPFVFRMHDSLALKHKDTYAALWQNWWMREALLTGQDISFSELLFHPHGLDLTFQPRRWTAFPIWTALYTAFGDPLAFNLTAMIGVLFKAYGMYLLGLYVLRSRVAAWVAAAFYAFSAPSLAIALQQPNTGATEWLPWFMLAFACGINQVGARASLRSVALSMLVSALLFALNAYMNIKIGIFAMLLGGVYLCLRTLRAGLWRQRRYWHGLLMFALAALLLCAPLGMMSLRSEGALDAIRRGVVAGRFGGVDVLAYLESDQSKPLYFVNAVAALAGEQLPLLQLPYHLSHLGLLSFVFAGVGAACAFRRERAALDWLIMAIVFGLLSLGLDIHIGGQHLEAIYWTPYRLVEGNIIFEFLRWPHRFALLFVFPFSLLIGYGLRFRLRSVNWNRSTRAMVVLATVLLLFGTSIFPLPMKLDPRPPYLSALARLPEGAVIDVPLDDSQVWTMVYMALQRTHQRPILGGYVARLPASAFEYIESNLLLNALRTRRMPSNVFDEELRDALAELRGDGFRYFVIHARNHDPFIVYGINDGWESQHFRLPPPVYVDEDVRIIDISEWEGPYLAEGSAGYRDLPSSHSLGINVGDRFTLHNWSLRDSVDVTPCQAATVESWWEAAGRSSTPYTLTLVLSEEDGDGQVAITNKPPADTFTPEWRTGRYYQDLASIAIPCEIKDGKYLLLLGMKESLTGVQLALSAADGASIGSLYYLTTLNVRRS